MAQIDEFDIADFRRRVADTARTEAFRNAIYELLRFTEEKSDRIKGGKATFGSFHYQINVKNQTRTLFTCDASGIVSVSLSNFVGWNPLVAGPQITRLRSTLAQIPGFESFSKDYPSRPGFLIERTVVDPNVMSRFQRAILRFQKDAKGS